uniref:DUF834 domain-containing protein n=1 Tax=Oryza sativa subsp. japonica TaxID=39947 RepID=Q69WU0_ORYSJ|nr:hypothetical protein [Oryza sativa Japonica Group]
MVRLHATTGDRELGWAIRGHLREEDDDANSSVQETTTDDDVRRPAMRTNGSAARVDDGGGIPAACDDGEGVAEVLLHRANPAAATLAAVWRDWIVAGDGGGLSYAAAALRATAGLGTWGKWKRTTRGCFI